MAFEFHLPDIGEGLAEATIVSWRVPVGARVGLDEPMVEIETDKAVVEIPAPRAGVILHHGAGEGQTIEVESLLVVIGDEGESWSPSSAPDKPPVKRAASDEAKPIVGNLDGPPTPSVGGRPQALPLVRRLAGSLGVDLSTIRGSGPGGRILRADVEQAAAGAGAMERVKMSPTRLAIARNLQRSWQEIPHVTTFGVADAQPLMTRRREFADSGTAMPLEALLVHALVPVLQRHPAFNAAVDGEYMVFKKQYDIGVAVDTPEGLMVAVLRDAADREPADLASDVLRLAKAARERTIAAADLRGATFTISNIGAVGGGFGTPIIPYGTTAILSVGRADERPVVRDGTVGIGREMPLSLSYDHRAIDGASGRAFLADCIEAIESV